MIRRTLLLGALSIAVITCYSFEPPDGIPCSADRRCPKEQFCAADDRCYATDSTPNGDSSLSALSVSIGTLEPAFDPSVTSYTVVLGLGAADVSLTPTAAVANGVVITVGDDRLESGQASSEAPIELGDSLIDVAVLAANGSSTTYTVNIKRGAGLLQQAYVKSSNSEALDGFGSRVVLAADGDTLAVSAFGEDSVSTGIGGNQMDNTAGGAGAVYVFVRDGSSWQQQAYVKASNAEAGDGFGFGLAMSADGNTMAVGAIGEDSASSGVGGDQADNNLSTSGAVYVFVRVGSSWQQDAYVKASTPGVGDAFGAVIALSADGGTLAVAAPDEASAAIGIGGDESDNSATRAGAVYVFAKGSAVWEQKAFVKASNTNAEDAFGGSVALDAVGATLAVGAPREGSSATDINGDQASNTANQAGAVYVFARAGESWAQEAYVKASNTDSGDQFGASVSLSSDGGTLAVGAPEESSPATGINGDENSDEADQAGAVYVLVRTADSWIQEAYVKASNTGRTDRFGSGVDLNPSGEILAVGASSENSSATGVGGNENENSAEDSGAAYVLVRTAAGWSQQAYIKASNTDPNDGFGRHVSIAEDTLAVSSPGEESSGTGIGANENDNSASVAGAVYVFQ